MHALLVRVHVGLVGDGVAADVAHVLLALAVRDLDVLLDVPVGGMLDQLKDHFVICLGINDQDHVFSDLYLSLATLPHRWHTVVSFCPFFMCTYCTWQRAAALLLNTLE